MNTLCGKHDTYTVSSTFREGKFSSVMIGRRESDQKKIIIKQLKNQDCLGDSRTEDLIREILLGLGDLHPSIAKTLDVFTHDKGACVVREFIEGIDLKSLLSDKNMRYFSTPDFTAKVGIAVCDILQSIHSKGIVHRDIKPANVLIEYKKGEEKPDYQTPVVRLIDFELAQIHGLNIFTMQRSPVALVYSSPEQLLRYQELIDETSDLFSLAITLYELLALKPAFFHSNPELLMNVQLNYPIVKHVRVPHELFAILHKATQKQPFQLPPHHYSHEERELLLMKGKELRFKNANELKQALENFLNKYDALPPANTIVGKIRSFFR